MNRPFFKPIIFFIFLFLLSLFAASVVMAGPQTGEVNHNLPLDVSENPAESQSSYTYFLEPATLLLLAPEILSGPQNSYLTATEIFHSSLWPDLKSMLSSLMEYWLYVHSAKDLHDDLYAWIEVIIYDSIEYYVSTHPELEETCTFDVYPMGNGTLALVVTIPGLGTFIIIIGTTLPNPEEGTYLITGENHGFLIR